MNRSYFYRMLLLSCLAGGLCLNGYSQTSPYEHPNLAPYKITPLAHLLSSINNIMYGGYSYLGADQDWDTLRQHYTGNILSYLHYPEIPAVGYHAFSVRKGYWREGTGILYGADDKAMKSTVSLGRQSLDQDKEHRKTSYYVNDQGWLTAIHSEQLNPQYQGFVEDRDSFSYVFRDDGSVLIRWSSFEHSSGSGYIGNIACGPFNQPFHHVYRRSLSTLTLDRWHNMTKIETVSNELWDSCTAGGTKHYSKEMQYDNLGRLARVTDSSGEYTSRSSEYSYDYRTMPLDRFLDSVKEIKAYAPLRLPAAAAWLREREPLRYLRVTQTIRSYTQYDSKLKKTVLHADSPVVSSNHAQFIIDGKQRRAVSWDDKLESFRDPASFALYEPQRDSLQQYEGVVIRYLPFTAAEGDGVLSPVAISGFLRKGVYRGHSLRYYQYNEEMRYDSAQPSVKEQLKPSGRIQSMVLMDGPLASLIWVPGNIYELTYQ